MKRCLRPDTPVKTPSLETKEESEIISTESQLKIKTNFCCNICDSIFEKIENLRGHLLLYHNHEEIRCLCLLMGLPASRRLPEHRLIMSISEFSKMSSYQNPNAKKQSGDAVCEQNERTD